MGDDYFLFCKNGNVTITPSFHGAHLIDNQSIKTLLRNDLSDAADEIQVASLRR